MGAIVLFDPELVKGRIVQLVAESDLVPLTSVDWEAIGLVSYDDGSAPRYIVSKPRKPNIAGLRRALAEAFVEGVQCARRHHMEQKRVDDVAEAEAYAKTCELPEGSAG
jgi:hypothetical protein